MGGDTTPLQVRLDTSVLGVNLLDVPHLLLWDAESKDIKVAMDVASHNHLVHQESPHLPKAACSLGTGFQGPFLSLACLGVKVMSVTHLRSYDLDTRKRK